VEYGKVVELIDLVKQNAITAFALDIEKGSPPLAPVPSPAAPSAVPGAPGGAP
jgi:hypothetical protein